MRTGRHGCRSAGAACAAPLGGGEELAGALDEALAQGGSLGGRKPLDQACRQGEQVAGCAGAEGERSSAGTCAARAARGVHVGLLLWWCWWWMGWGGVGRDGLAACSAGKHATMPGSRAAAHSCTSGRAAWPAAGHLSHTGCTRQVESTCTLLYRLYEGKADEPRAPRAHKARKARRWPPGSQPTAWQRLQLQPP